MPGWVAAGMTHTEGAALISSSVRIARDVRDRFIDDLGGSERRWVAASVGPYGAVLADGSEYRGRYGLSAAQLRDFHGPRMELLAAAGPDVLAVETIPDVDEAEVLVSLLDQIGLPAWVSYAADGSMTRAGQPLADAFAVASSARTVFAAGVNCCAPSEVLPAVRAAGTTGLPVVAYPNGGRAWDPVRRQWVGKLRFDPDLVPAWVAAGAAYVGGCCQVGPGEISRLATAVADRAVFGPEPTG